MATGAQVFARVRALLIDVPTATESELLRWVNRAQEVFEDRKALPMQKFEASGITIIGNSAYTLSAAAGSTVWIDGRGNPWLVDAAVTPTDWFEVPLVASQEEVRRIDEAAYVGDTNARPKHAVLTVTASAFTGVETHALRLYPPPDKLYSYNFPYWGRIIASADNGNTNWFTNHAEDYMVWAAAAEGFLFNRDREEHLVFFAKAQAEMRRIIRREKVKQTGSTFDLTPKRDVNAHTAQGRM